MKLTLSVISFSGAEVRCFKKITLNQESATLGRNENNTLVLPDSENFVSAKHAEIEFLSPHYFLTDTSTNGVFINDSETRLGRGKSVKLNDGDRLTMGHYVIEVHLDKIVPEPQPLPPASDTPSEWLYPGCDGWPAPPENPVDKVIDNDDSFPPDWDRSIKFKKQTVSSPDIVRIPPEKEPFPKISAEKKESPGITTSSNIPTNNFPTGWYQDDLKSDKNNPQLISTSDTEPQLQIEKRPAIPEPVNTQIEISKEEIPSPENIPPTNALAEEFIQNFLRGAQLDDSRLNDSINPQTFFIIGIILRATIQGTMDVLLGRAKIKNEMHLDVTMIRSRNNNPIKFSISADEALVKLLMNPDKGYLPPEEAIREAFDDIRAHQYSVIAGMRTALLSVLKRFDPKKLEKRLQEASPISATIPIHKQAKLWSLFEQLYQNIEHEAEDNFYHLFGQSFAETYEQQMQNIKKSKKDKPFD